MPKTSFTAAGLKPFITGRVGKSIFGRYEESEDEEMAKAIDAKEGFKFGCDPEMFIKNAEGKHVSAATLLPGSKEAPHKVPGGAVHPDGMAAEFGIDPVDNFSDWNKNIDLVMKSLKELLPEGHELDIIPTVTFDADVFALAPDDAKELGCTPDFNAWTGEMNPPPHDPDNPYLRTASGHIHIGWTDDADVTDPQHIMNCRDLVKQLDWYLGGWSLKMSPDATRRKLYGKAGACRFKSYGVEYRVLDNFWITTRERRLTVWNRLQLAIMHMTNRFIPERLPASFNEQLIEAINTSQMPKDLAANCRFPLTTTDAYYARF